MATCLRLSRLTELDIYKSAVSSLNDARLILTVVRVDAEELDT